jgi:glycosyltransferase involved in cell wall biosynthesis
MKTPIRVMWLLNHTGARRFEIPMLKRLGISEIFLPKRYPNDPGFRTASIDFSEDSALTLPDHELQILNSADWYDNPGPDAVAIANRYFSIAFFIMHRPGILKALSKGFDGAVIWRAYGLSADTGYGKSLDYYFGAETGPKLIKALGPRFWFGEAYSHLHQGEPSYIRNRSIFLPAGLPAIDLSDEWTGSDRKVLFVCPDIGINTYYASIYESFTKAFSGLPYAVGGAQPIRIEDPHVLGFVPLKVYQRNMRQMRVMYYHSTEPNHVHYHPFEAIQVGMPLVFMGGGLLDKFGGKQLAGHCQSVQEARSKITRILDDDRTLIDEIRATQPRLLLPMRFEGREPAWRSGIDCVLDGLNQQTAAKMSVVRQSSRIAVILPELYRGGTLQGAKLLAKAIKYGSHQCGERAEVVFAHLDHATYREDDFDDLPPGIAIRPFAWLRMLREQAERAMTLAGIGGSLTADEYICPNDGIQQFLDCDLWVFVSDRLSLPVLPIRPYVLMVYDYLQRYVDVMPSSINTSVTAAARRAARVLVTTEFTKRDAVQFAGVREDKLIRVPMLAPEPTDHEFKPAPEKQRRYFIWTTNVAPHKNHETSFEALTLYYTTLNGALECRVTGVKTKEFLESSDGHLGVVRALVDAYPSFQRRLKILGELPYQTYLRQLSGAEFLWHTSRLDNGTFAMIEAAHLGVPTLSSDYPAIREEALQFGLEPAWMDQVDPRAMAQQLKHMETNGQAARNRMPTARQLAENSVENLARAYWEAIRACL